MTTIQIKLKDVYVDRLPAIISNYKEIPIDDIAINSLTQTGNTVKLQKKQKLMRIAQECASLSTVKENSPEHILGYDQSEFGLWGSD